MPSREELAAQVIWNSGGSGLGICRVANALIRAMDRPGPNNPDYPSIVAVSDPQEKYTDEELTLIVEFAQRATAKHDEMFRFRRGANLILFDKEEWNGRTLWMRKRLTWEYGPMFSPTLVEAIASMDR
jgi:hypothetical protein